MPVLFPRSPWPPDFPDVFVHGDLRARNAHPAYPAAKSGDADAAKVLVEALLSGAATDRIAEFLAGRRPALLAVTADEVAGFNAIPDAMAQALGARLGLDAPAGRIVQANKVGHTKADGWHRLVTPAKFIGEVAPGLEFILVDDHVGFGGTLANLRGFIQVSGGSVLGMTTLTETRAAREIAIREKTRNMLHGRHGSDIEELWLAEFGHGTDCLTNIEGE